MTPANVGAPVDPIMVVTLGTSVHRIRVKPGSDGMREFQQQIRALFQIPDSQEFEVSFKCKAPNSGEPLCAPYLPIPLPPSCCNANVWQAQTDSIPLP